MLHHISLINNELHRKSPPITIQIILPKIPQINANPHTHEITDSSNCSNHGFTSHNLFTNTVIHGTETPITPKIPREPINISNRTHLHALPGDSSSPPGSS